MVCGGEAATPMLTATMKNTGASTSAATERPRFVAVPLRTRRNDTIAGMIAMRHSRAPSGVVGGIIASSAPRAGTTKVTAPKPLREHPPQPRKKSNQCHRHWGSTVEQIGVLVAGLLCQWE